MQIKQLSISNYRGIKKLDKSFDKDFVCLLGPGDSSKSTILNAIEILFYPSWKLNMNDSDFHDHNLDGPIEILATITDFPEEFLSDSKYGLFVRGWDNGTIHDEPEPNDKIALTVRLQIDKTLEPEWRIINNREPEGTKISHTDRAKLKVLKIGDYLERQFYWRRGTLLNQLTDDSGDADSIILEANRKIRNETSFEDDPIIDELLKSTLDNAKSYGVNFDANKLKALLDTKYLQKNLGIVGLHDGDIPLRLKGLSTKRLFLISLQLLPIDSGATLLVDEIELGFEPHRLRNVLRRLKNLSSDTSQIFITTHSPITTVELTTEDIFITRSNNGEVTLLTIDDTLQGTIRSSPEALFGKTVIVCEGQTEIGICRAIDTYYKESEDSFSYLGINLVNGEGSNSSERALHFKNLGFKTLLFIDSDDLESFTPEISELEDEDIKIIHWSDEVCTEERVIKDLNLESVVEIIELALDINTLNEDQLLQSISSRVNDINLSSTKNILEYSNSNYESDLKNSVAKSIKGKGLFKNITKGEIFGNYLLENMDKFKDTDTDIKLRELKSYIYE